MGDWNPIFEIPTTITGLFAIWKNSYPGPSPKNKLIKAAWSSLLKICCWQLWLERNGRIFKSIQHNAKKVTAKVKSQLKECLGEQKDDSNLSQIDIDWGSSMDLQFHQKTRSMDLPEEWQIRGKNSEDFQNWIPKQKVHSLFFDGAAKRNLGNAGAGGVIKNIDGVSILQFSWGLGINSSIQVEALALFQGLNLLLKLEIEEAIIFGDSEVIIKTMVTNSILRDLRLERLIQRIRSVVKLFQNLKYFHVLRGNNKEADIEANKAAQLSVGAMKSDGEETWVPIP